MTIIRDLDWETCNLCQSTTMIESLDNDEEGSFEYNMSGEILPIASPSAEERAQEVEHDLKTALEIEGCGWHTHLFSKFAEY